MDDSLVIAKLHFSSYVPGIVEPFLKQFQADKLMIPLLFFRVENHYSSFWNNYAAQVIESYRSASQLKEIDLTDKTKLLPADKINKSLLC